MTVNGLDSHMHSPCILKVYNIDMFICIYMCTYVAILLYVCP